MVLPILIIFLGCSTPPKKKHHVMHRKTVVHKEVSARSATRKTTPSEDAAVDAIIKSLRNGEDED